MRKVMAILVLLAMCVMSAGCGEPKVIGGQWRDTVGIFSDSNDKHPCIRYSVSAGNVFLSILFSEMIIVPIYFVGWSIQNPVGEICQGCFARYANTGVVSCPTN
jgi:hypothetical protein